MGSGYERSLNQEKIMTTTKPNVNFSNPEKLPLEKLTLSVDEDGITIKVPALHKRWATRRIFNTYPPLIGAGGLVKTDADLDEWFYESRWFLDDMMFLLGIKQYEFWSHMIHQTTAMASLISFLKNATPCYLDLQSLTSNEQVLLMYNDILTAVTRTVCRIITNKESEEEWISKDYLADLIYSNFLISIPMLFDLIVALSESNSNILRKIIKTVFLIEPKYKNDLTTALQNVKIAFSTIQQSVEDDMLEYNETLETPYDDLVLYILDIAFTLSVLFDVCPEARDIGYEINLGPCITQFYDNSIPYIYKSICIIHPSANSLKWLNEARLQFLKAFRSIAYLHVENVLKNPEESLLPSERFVGLMTECLADRMFVIDYQREYPIELDVEILKQACKDLDEFKMNFVAKGYKDEAESEALGTIGCIEDLEKLDIQENGLPSTLSNTLPARQEPEGAASIDYDNDKPSTSRGMPALTTTASNGLGSEANGRNFDTEVVSVLEVLPHLGDGFVRRVLNRYDNSEEAIAAILEQNLPPDLMNSDQSEVYIPADPQDTLYQQTGIKRFNVFDGDKYDVMTQDNPDCIIKVEKGFPNQPKNLGELLDDKKELDAVRHRYQEYTLVEEGNEYDDEYDDSYEALLESESRMVKSKELKENLTEIIDVSDEGESSDEDVPENANETVDKRLNFCENPEDVRARYEARRASKYGNKQAQQPAPPKQRDVVGAPKGQGQDKQVLINRHKKDVQKSSRANHNRKAGAAFKRSKGMMS